jgi:hypothetical protein
MQLTCFYVFIWVRDEMKILIFPKALERPFDGSHPTVRAALKNGWDAPKSGGQKSAMSAECEDDSKLDSKQLREK